MLRFDRFKQRVVRGGALGRPAWQLDPAFDLARHVQSVSLERMDERELGDLPFPGWPWPRAAECAGECLLAGGR